MIIPHTNTKIGVSKMSFFKKPSILMDVLTSTPNKVFKICKEQRICPFMESPCEKYMFNTTLTKVSWIIVFKISRRMDFILGNSAKMLPQKLYLMIKSQIHKEQPKRELSIWSPLTPNQHILFTLVQLFSDSNGVPPIGLLNLSNEEQGEVTLYLEKQCFWCFRI